MKTKIISLLSASMIILAGCSGGTEENVAESEEGMGTLSTENDSENSSNDGGLLDFSNTDAGWINFEGDVGGNSEYRIVENIAYNSNEDYELNVGAYVSYYDGDEFIKTIQQPEGMIEQVEAADNIKVSYHHSFEDRISLIKQ